jgi:hypothetical protein
MGMIKELKEFAVKGSVLAIPLKATRCPHCTSELKPAA